jgi:hypothetical protein
MIRSISSESNVPRATIAVTSARTTPRFASNSCLASHLAKSSSAVTDLGDVHTTRERVTFGCVVPRAQHGCIWVKDQLADFARTQFDDLRLHTQETFRVFDAGNAELGLQFCEKFGD